MLRTLPFLVSLCLFAATAALATSAIGPHAMALLRFAPTQEAEATPVVTMIAVGDVMPSREVARTLAAPPLPTYPFSQIGTYLHSADFVFGNLESPILEGGLVDRTAMQFRAGPGIETILREVGFAVMSVANNHIYDYGEKGVLRTLELLEKAGIRASGAGKNIETANAPVYVTRKGLTFAFLSYVDPGIASKASRPTDTHAGAAIMDIPAMQGAVADARVKADIVIVSMHSGIEYTALPTIRQKDFAHAAIDAGATAVIGAHPHVIQPVEIYKGRYILYSLGNFVFDQMWSNDTRQGMTAKMTFTPEGLTALEFVPIFITDSFEPAPADTATKMADLKRLEGLGWRSL